MKLPDNMTKHILLSCMAALAASLTIQAQTQSQSATQSTTQSTDQTAEYLPQWEEGCLDIHTISTGRGDACLIIMPDGTTMMIDAGDNGKAKDKQHPDNSLRAGEWQARYIKHFIQGLPGNGKIDYALITHLHNDHMGSCKEALPAVNGYLRSGITLVADEIPYCCLVDRAWPDYDFPSKGKVLSANKGFMEEYFKFIEYQRGKGMRMEQFQVGSNKQFRMKYARKAEAGFEIRNLCANGELWTGKGCRCTKMYSGDPMLFDENMNSCAIRLRYGRFSYYNGGDLSGGNYNIYPSQERDFESLVGPVCGEVTAMKANHHGYFDTCNDNFLNALDPEVFIVDARSNNHPVPPTFSRLSRPDSGRGACEYYITVDQARGKLGEELWSRFQPWGHIVIRVYPGGGSYQVFVLDADSLDYRVIHKSGLRQL